MTQDEALDLLKCGENVFLTGAAGAGKTHLLNRYIKYLRSHVVDIAVTASTGIAATHLNGRTIHSWSGIGVREYLTPQDLEKLLTNKRVARNYRDVKVLVIDEVSMLHPHQLDMVDQIARNMLEPDMPFGGIQVVLCGDFFQLPPVSRGGNSADKKFAYDASAWETAGFQICYLHEQHRQGDDELLTILNDIRSGSAGEHSKVPLRTRYKREPAGSIQPTKLYTRNINVDSINNTQLHQLQAEEKRFLMKSTGFSALVEGLMKSCLAPEDLRLKVGAEVMFVKNATDGAYVNGTRGVVTKFDKDSGWPVVKTFDNEIITASPEEWQQEDNGSIRATISQVPLRLAWAITIHKSQGMTLDAAEVDLGDAFEPGMGYVALSRVRRLDGLKLMNLNEMALQVHPAILSMDTTFQKQSKSASKLVNNMSANEKQDQQQEVLFKRFKGRPEAITEEELAAAKAAKRNKPKKIPSQDITLGMLENAKPIAEIAAERELKLGTVLDHIEKLQGLSKLPDIDYIKAGVAKADFETILSEFKKSKDGKLGPIHKKLAGKYSYDELRLVRLFVAV